MRGLRAALYPLRLVGARLSRRSAPVVLVVLGIAAGASVVLGGRAGALVAQDRAVAQAVERIQDGQRSVRAVWFGIPGQSDEPQPMLERRARAALARTGAGSATSLVLFRETSVGGTFAGPRRRRGSRTLGDAPVGSAPPDLHARALRGAPASRSRAACPGSTGSTSSRSGEAVLENRVLFGDFLAPTDNALEDAEVSPSLARAAGYHRPPPPPLFLAEGVAALAGAPALERVYRSYAWVAPLAPGRPRLWEVDDLAAAVTDARSELQAVTTGFDLVAPVEELREAQATSRAAGRRLGVVGGEAAALLFAFALLAAMTLRPDLLAARRRLAWYGARGWQLALVTVAESAALALAGTAIGLAVALIGGAVVAERAGAPVGRRARAQHRLGRRARARAARRRGRDRRPRRRRDRARVAVALRAARCRRRCRCGARRPRGLARRRRGRSPAAAARARHVRRSRPRHPAAAAGAPARRAARPRPLARAPDRLADARPQPGLRDRGHGLPRRQLRAGALRRELPLDARTRRARPGRAPGSARLRRPGGPAASDPGAGRGVARTVSAGSTASRSRPCCG